MGEEKRESKFAEKIVRIAVPTRRVRQRDLGDGLLFGRIRERDRERNWESFSCIFLGAFRPVFEQTRVSVLGLQENPTRRSRPFVCVGPFRANRASPRADALDLSGISEM